jgi:HTH-like domain
LFLLNIFLLLNCWGFEVFGEVADTGSYGEYGWPRIWKKLLANSIGVGKERIPRLMKLLGIKARGNG